VVHLRGLSRLAAQPVREAAAAGRHHLPARAARGAAALSPRRSPKESRRSNGVPFLLPEVSGAAAPEGPAGGAGHPSGVPGEAPLQARELAAAQDHEVSPAADRK